MKFDFKELESELPKINASKRRAVKFLSEKGISLNLPPVDFEINVASLKEIKIAAIMDEFTLHCYQPECSLLQVSPEHFREELDFYLPDMLFVESAWNGNGGLWKDKIANGSAEYFALAEYCKQKRIPVIFWNKEDPVHFNDFLHVAKTADYVFTTDRDVIPKYRRILESDKIYHLHFAAQPKLHNPIEIEKRQDKFCFAGTYYRCYPERAEAFNCFARFFLSTRGLAIYDREYKKKKSAYRFPRIYKPYILGTLKPDEIEKAYKGYFFGINMNTITASSTMFSRRVFELMASNTIVVGNYAKGLDNYFGDMTICTDDAGVLADMLEERCSNEGDIHKYRLRGLREVLTSHLYEDRLNDIVRMIYGVNLKADLPGITVISEIHSYREGAWLKKEFDSQCYSKKNLILFFPDNPDRKSEMFGYPVIDSLSSSIGEIIASGYVSYFHPEDYYAPNYLFDLIYTLRYRDSKLIAKDAYHCIENGTVKYRKGSLYSSGNSVATRRAIIDREFIAHMSIRDFLVSDTINGPSFYIDEWNYCENAHYVKCNNVVDI